MAQSQLCLKSYDVSSVKGRFRLIQRLHTAIYVRAVVMTGHCPSQRVPHFLQMRSIEEATRGGMLLGVAYFFSITIGTNTLALSQSRPGVHWHQLSHYSGSWQNPKWLSSHWIITICTQFTDKNELPEVIKKKKEKGPKRFASQKILKQHKVRRLSHRNTFFLDFFEVEFLKWRGYEYITDEGKLHEQSLEDYAAFIQKLSQHWHVRSKCSWI